MSHTNAALRPRRTVAAAAVALLAAGGLVALPTAASAATSQTMQFVSATYSGAMAKCTSERSVWIHDGWRVSACTLVGYGPGVTYVKFTATR